MINKESRSSHNSEFVMMSFFYLFKKSGQHEF